jgi:ABC-type amino acid transport substrate-binding protein
MKRPLFIIAGCLAAAALIIALRIGAIRSQRSSDSTFIVGTAAGYAPFVSVNEKGDYEGFDIDVANTLAKAMGKKLVLRDLGSMTSLFMALDQGSIDAIIWGLSIVEDRLKKVAMIRYQGETVTSYPLIFWKKIPEGIKSINDMKGMTVCVEPTSHQDMVLSKYSSIEKKLIEKVDDGLLNIQYGKADAAFVEPAIANKFKKKYPEMVMLDVQLGPEDQVRGMGIAVKKENTGLIKQIEQGVEQLKSNGTLETLEKKWLS